MGCFRLNSASVTEGSVVVRCFEIGKLLRGTFISAVACETNTFSSGVES